MIAQGFDDRPVENPTEVAIGKCCGKAFNLFLGQTCQESAAKFLLEFMIGEKVEFKENHQQDQMDHSQVFAPLCPGEEKPERQYGISPCQSPVKIKKHQAHIEVPGPCAPIGRCQDPSRRGPNS